MAVYNVWLQRSNPVTATTAGVDGYVPVDVRISGGFTGLERNMRKIPNSTLLDGEAGSRFWFYSGTKARRPLEPLGPWITPTVLPACLS